MDRISLKSLIGVEKTMLMPLWGRWSESIKENGLIYDKKSIELVNNMEFDFSNIEKSQHPVTRLAWIARAWNTDHELSTYAPKNKEFTTICLGCGLDTAFYRNDFPLMNWIDVDLVNIIEVRKQLLGDTKGATMHAGSVLNKSTYDNIQTNNPVIVIALGLLCYFSESDVKVIMNNISSLSLNVIIIMDYFSEIGIAISNKMVLPKDSDIKMIWHANSQEDLLSLHPNIEIIETYPMFRKIIPYLSPEEKAMASISDQKAINSIAVMKFK